MTTTEGEQVGSSRRHAWLGDVRLRILASYLILLTLAASASVLVVRQALLVRMDDQVARDLLQEVEEFRRLAGGVDPETGRPFGRDTDRIFTVYLERNVPGANEQLLTVPRRGTPRYRAAEGADVPIGREYRSLWRGLSETREGELETTAGPARYMAVPVLDEGRSLGAFVVAHFTDGDREAVDEAVGIVAAVALGVLLLGTVLAFLSAGRVLAPLRGLRDAARSISGSDMTRRLVADGSDEIADLGRTFNRMLDRLEFAFSSQRSFIRDISHELRTPIAVIRGHLELLGESAGTDAAARAQTVELVTAELDRMSTFVDDLLLLAKAEQPDFLRLETVRLDELCEQVVVGARGLGRRDWRVEARSRRSVVADPQRLTQAVMNLVRNALEHTGKLDVIEVGCALEDGWAELWVRDSGEGVAPEDQARIMQRFERGRASRRRYEGSGLGLAIVSTIAEAHGGSLALESRLGEGATFTLRIPTEGPEGEGAA